MSLNNQHFVIFIGLSLAIHAAALTIVLPENSVIFTKRNNGTLDIELVIKRDSIKATQPHHNQKILSQPRHDNASVTLSVVADQNMKNTTAVDASSDLPINIHDISNSVAESIVSKKISIALLRYFHYPDTAIRRNWQGDVILQFTLMPDGHLDHIRIHQSSGYKALDDAALRALQQVAPQQELALLTDANVLHTLPVRYRLIDAL